MSNNHQRTETIRGLRELADFLEANPGIPVGNTASLTYFPRSTDELERAEVDRIAALLGAKASGTTHYTVSRMFGVVEYAAVAIHAEYMARHDALMTYRDVVVPADETVAEVA